MSDKCPSCSYKLQFKKPIELYQSVTCTNCGLEFEVVWLYPLEMAKVIENLPRQNQTVNSNDLENSAPDISI